MQEIHFYSADRRFIFPGKAVLKELIAKVFKKEKKTLVSLNYIFCSDDYLLEINQNFLQHDDYTDIISFDLSEQKGLIQGEIYISLDRVKENSSILHLPFKTELLRVILHGALHLCGYKDKKRKEILAIRQKEEHYLRLFKKMEGK